MKKHVLSKEAAITPSLCDIEKSLNIRALHESWRAHWSDSQASYPGRQMVLFDDAFIREANDVMRLPDEAFAQFQQALSIVRSREDLCRLLWHGYYLLFVASTPSEKISEIIIENWPKLPDVMGNLTGMSGLIAFLLALPRARSFYREKGIPQQVLLDTFTDIMVWMKHYYRKHGVWGLGEICWLVHHFSCHVFSIGRLQYTLLPLPNNIKVYRSRKTGKVVAISAGGDTYRSDGLVNGTNGIHDPLGTWVSTFTATDKTVTGNPITPAGRAVNKPVTLSLKEWELQLQGGDTILEVHITEGRKLLLEQYIQSYHDALAFFGRHFSDRSVKGFATHTWLFDPQLRNLLSVEKSNILKFQLGYYLVPILADDSQAIERVYGFGLKTIDVPVARRDTTLRRTMADFVMAGNRMRSTAGFMLLDEVDKPYGFYSDNFGIDP